MAATRALRIATDKEPGLVRVGLVARSPETATSVKSTLRRAGIHCSREFRSIGELSDSPGIRGLDALILQFETEEWCARDEISTARAAVGGTPIIAILGAGRGDEHGRALRCGLDGVVLGDQLETTLALTVRAVSAGLSCVPRRLRSELNRENLSSREKQILGLVVTGSSNAQIAARLYLAESTVKSHLSSAYEKLGVRSRKDAAALILDPRLGLDRGILAVTAA